MGTTDDNRTSIDLLDIIRKLWHKKGLFLKIWGITFVLSCIWVLPQPRYYTCEVKLAPELGAGDLGGGLSSLASTFGFDLGNGGGQDAIYPALYPELFESPEFAVGLFGIQVTNLDSTISTDYYTYMKLHQKKNPITQPYIKARRAIKNLLQSKPRTGSPVGQDGKIDPFNMSEDDQMLMKMIIENIHCSVDTRTSVISIKVTDQDPLICATMADSVKKHLQDFIIEYRTSKVSEDVEHYRQMRDESKQDYLKALRAYSDYSDRHMNVALQTYKSELDRLENEMSLSLGAMNAMETQLRSAQVKLQEKIPAFTTIKSATVPIKPAGPKRMLFVLCILVLTTLFASIYILRDDLKKFVVIYGNRQ